MICAFFGQDEVDQIAGLVPCRLHGPGLCVSHPVLERGGGTDGTLADHSLMLSLQRDDGPALTLRS